MKNLDSRQTGLAKLLLDKNGEAGEAKVEVVLQESNYAGLSAAVKQAEALARESNRRAGIIRVNAADGAWLGLMSAGWRFGTSGVGYLGRISKLIELAKDRAVVTLVLDHAGEMKPQRVWRLVKICEEVAERLQIAVRLVLIITKVQVYVSRQKPSVAMLPAASELVKPRARTWEYGPHGFKFVRNAESVRLLDQGEPLLDGVEAEQNGRQRKIA